MTRSVLTPLLAALFLLLTGCASIDSHVNQFVGVSSHPPSDPAKIEIIRLPATIRTFDKLGDIYVTASVDPPAEVAKVEAKLRADAAKLGADAVLINFDQIIPVGAYIAGWYAPTYQTITARRVIATAIKFK
jgi:hypothetical protein